MIDQLGDIVGQLNVIHKPNTVVSEIFAGCNFREFRDKGRVHENLFAKFNMGGYKMAAVVKTDFC